MAFEKHGVVPDVITKAPQKLLEVTYPDNIKVDNGNELTPTQVKDEPKVTWEADSNDYYLLVMVDPDAPNRKEPTSREVLHWAVGNIPGNDVSKGEVLFEYIGSGPPQGTGLHRYIFLLYKQPGKVNYDQKRVTNKSREGRISFSIKEFAAKHNLGNPVAGNFYQAQWDEYVSILHIEKHGVVPDVITKTPEKLLKTVYPGDIRVDNGNKLTPKQVKN